MLDYQKIIDNYYASGSDLRRILMLHSSQVAELALDIAKSRSLDIADEDITAAAMLHDIGIFKTYAPSICCMGDRPYICHGIIGAALLREQGCPEWVARVAERHTGAGLTAQDIIEQNLPLPSVDMLPESQLERLICYADKFYSKSGDMQRKPFDRVRLSMAKHGDATLGRFDAMDKEFHIPGL